MKYFFIALLLIVCSISQAQVAIRDKMDNSTVAYVQIFSSEGNLIGISSENGLIDKQLLTLIVQDDSEFFYLRHLAYKEARLKKEDLKSGIPLFLERQLRQLEEVIVKPTLKYNHLLMIGYYRSYGIDNSKLISATEGQIAFLFPKNSKKNVLNKRIQERNYLHKEIVLNGSTNYVNTIGPPCPDMNLMNSGRSDFDYFDSEKSNYFLNFSKNKRHFEYVELSNGNKLPLVEIAFIFRGEVKDLSLGQRQSKMDYHTEYTVFNAKDSTDLALENMLYHKEVRKYDMTLNNVSHRVESVKELYISEAKYIEKPEKGFRLFTGFIRNSNYTSDFWKEAEKHPFYQPLPSGVAESLKNNLKLLPNKQNK